MSDVRGMVDPVSERPDTADCDAPSDEFKVGTRVRIPPSNWRPSTTGTVVDASEFCATGPVYVKRDDSGFTVGYRRNTLRIIAPATCRHGQPEGRCASCSACDACEGECGVCPFVTSPTGGGA